LSRHLVLKSFLFCRNFMFYLYEIGSKCCSLLGKFEIERNEVHHVIFPLRLNAKKKN
jgi:hypothetical protein